MTGSAAMLRALEERLERRDARIAVVGQGYVGLPLALRAAELGFPVTGYDTATGRSDPLRDGVPDLSFLENAASDLAPHLRPGVLVVLESTTYPGTTEELLRPALEH